MTDVDRFSSDTNRDPARLLRTGPTWLEVAVLGAMFVVPGLFAPQTALLVTGIVLLVGAVVVVALGAFGGVKGIRARF